MSDPISDEAQQQRDDEAKRNASIATAYDAVAQGPRAVYEPSRVCCCHKRGERVVLCSYHEGYRDAINDIEAEARLKADGK